MAAFHNIERRALGVKIDHGKIDRSMATQQQATEQGKMDRLYRKARLRAVIGAVLAALSLLFFSGGAALGGFNLLQGPG